MNKEIDTYVTSCLLANCDKKCNVTCLTNSICRDTVENTCQEFCGHSPLRLSLQFLQAETPLNERGELFLSMLEKH